MLCLISAAQQSHSAMHIYAYILFSILFHYALSQNIECSSLRLCTFLMWLLRKFKITCMVHIIFLLDRADLDETLMVGSGRVIQCSSAFVQPS